MFQIGDEYLKVMTTSTEMTVMEMKSEWISALDNVMFFIIAYQYLNQVCTCMLHQKVYRDLNFLQTA